MVIGCSSTWSQSADDACIFVRNMTFGDIGIERVDSGCQQLRLMLAFFCYDYGIPIVHGWSLPRSSCRAAADDEDIRMEFFFPRFS